MKQLQPFLAIKITPLFTSTCQTKFTTCNADTSKNFANNLSKIGQSYVISGQLFDNNLPALKQGLFKFRQFFRTFRQNFCRFRTSLVKCCDKFALLETGLGKFNGALVISKKIFTLYNLAILG